MLQFYDINWVGLPTGDDKSYGGCGGYKSITDGDGCKGSESDIRLSKLLKSVAKICLKGINVLEQP